MPAQPKVPRPSPATAATSFRLAPAVAALTTLAALTALVALAGPASAQGGPAVVIEKATNGVDADSGSGPAVEPGQAVTWTWTISATGSEALYDLVVSDSSGVTPNCDVNGDGQPDGTNIHPGPLEAGQSFRCTGSGAAGHTAADGTFAATGSVRASDFAAAATFTDDDPSHHHVKAPFSPTPGVSIQTVVGGRVADGANGPLVTEGVANTWTYVVRNTGNVPLTGIEVRDDQGLAIDCGGGQPTIAGPLAPGASVSCTAVVPAIERADGPQSRTGSAVAAAVHPTTGASVGQVSDTDPVTYTPVQVPTQLAFTGPGSFVLPLGLALTLIGATLLILARRREPKPATVPVDDNAVGQHQLDR